MIGLAAFLPVFLLTLPAGETADRYDRKTVLLWCFAGEMASVLTLAVATWQGWASVPLMLVIAALFGAARAFFAPANTALGPMLVPRRLLPPALLPVFARDVLVIPEGEVSVLGLSFTFTREIAFGILRSGPAIGATAVALTLAVRPIHHKAGGFMFSGVAVYGLATCVFALS